MKSIFIYNIHNYHYYSLVQERSRHPDEKQKPVSVYPTPSSKSPVPSSRYTAPVVLVLNVKGAHNLRIKMATFSKHFQYDNIVEQKNINIFTPSLIFLIQNTLLAVIIIS